MYIQGKAVHTWSDFCDLFRFDDVWYNSIPNPGSKSDLHKWIKRTYFQSNYKWIANQLAYLEETPEISPVETTRKILLLCYFIYDFEIASAFEAAGKSGSAHLNGHRLNRDLFPDDNDNLTLESFGCKSSAANDFIDRYHAFCLEQVKYAGPDIQVPCKDKFAGLLYKRIEPICKIYAQLKSRGESGGEALKNTYKIFLIYILAGRADTGLKPPQAESIVECIARAGNIKETKELERAVRDHVLRTGEKINQEDMGKYSASQKQFELQLEDDSVTRMYLLCSITYGMKRFSPGERSLRIVDKVLETGGNVPASLIITDGHDRELRRLKAAAGCTIKTIGGRCVELLPRISVCSTHIVYAGRNNKPIRINLLDNTKQEIPVEGHSGFATGYMNSTVFIKRDGKAVMYSSDKNLSDSVRIVRDAVSVAMSGTKYLFVKRDGTLATNIDTDNMKGIISAANWQSRMIALKSDGTVRSNCSEYDFSDWKNISGVYAGKEHFAAVTAENKVLVKGSSYFSQRDVDGWEDIWAVGLGNDFIVGLDGKCELHFAGRVEDLDRKILEGGDISEIAVNDSGVALLTNSGEVIYQAF